VERFVRDLTQNQLRRGVFRDLEELIMAKPFHPVGTRLRHPRKGQTRPPARCMKRQADGATV